MKIKDKIYKLIGQTVVYTVGYIVFVGFCYWGFLQGMTY